MRVVSLPTTRHRNDFRIVCHVPFFVGWKKKYRHLFLRLWLLSNTMQSKERQIRSVMRNHAVSDEDDPLVPIKDWTRRTHAATAKSVTQLVLTTPVSTSSEAAMAILASARKGSALTEPCIMSRRRGNQPLDEEHLPELLRRKAEFLHTLRSMIETSAEENNFD